VDRLVTLVVVVLAYNLLFAQWLRVGPLRVRFVPQEAWIGWTGIIVTWFGVGISIWARYCLGVYWSARVTLKEGHRLIRSGPYAFVRHPIYTGMLLGCVGAALVAGEWRGVLAVVLLLAAHSRKALREERLLAMEFGEEYAAYRRSTGFLFPRLGGKLAMDTRPGHS
jgi:protein-S-isoprenylcysteine O-methyltransferase Ste14